MTYEEAVASEHKVASVVEQVRGEWPTQGKAGAAGMTAGQPLLALRGQGGAVGPGRLQRLVASTGIGKSYVVQCKLDGAYRCSYSSLRPSRRSQGVTGKHQGSAPIVVHESSFLTVPLPPAPLQFPAVYEERALRLVHHSTEPLEQLAARVLAHFTNNFVVVSHLC